MSKKIGRFIQDKRLWLGTVAFFVILVTFLDDSNLIKQMKLHSKISTLEVEREYYQNKIVTDSIMLSRLGSDYYLEQYAREHYLMRREGEILYVIAP